MTQAAPQAVNSSAQAGHGIEQLRKDRQVASEEQTGRRLEAWFAARWPQASDIRANDFSIPADGISNSMLVFALAWRENGEPRSGRYVARLEPDDEPVAPKFSERYDSSVALEYRVQNIVAQQTRCPVAPLVGLETSAEILGRPFYVMAHSAGRTPPSQGPMIDSFLVRQATPAQRRRLVEQGLEVMIELHRLDYRAAGLQWLDPSDGGTYTLAPQIEAYRAISLRHLGGREHPLLMQTLDWLRDHQPQQMEPALVWGDSRPGNILFDADYGVAAALDWELGAIMPRDSDMGLWLLTDYMVHESEGAARLPGYPTRDEQVAYYESQSGRRLRDLAYWELFTAMKVAYVFVRVVRRMQAKGVMPADNDSLMFDNFAVRYLRERFGQTRSTLIQAER